MNYRWIIVNGCQIFCRSGATINCTLYIQSQIKQLWFLNRQFLGLKISCSLVSCIAMWCNNWLLPYTLTEVKHLHIRHSGQTQTTCVRCGKRSGWNDQNPVRANSLRKCHTFQTALITMTQVLDALMWTCVHGFDTAIPITTSNHTKKVSLSHWVCFTQTLL